MNLLGYSLNLLTLFALVLAIGIVVDDAIVVVEAVHAKMEHGISDAKKATIEAMHEITGAIISITLVMAAVFIPVSIIGAFFFLNLLGYSLNLLTLFALVLAIGIVVDDAIVVVEAVHAKMEHGISDAKKATIEAMHEITGAIVS